jgi:predicted nucleic acid-binding protein
VNVHLDTSLLIHATSSVERRTLLDRASERGNRLFVSTIVLYEWLRGPRTAVELVLVDALFPANEQVIFGLDEARAAARIYRAVSRARGRESDIAIAGCAVEHKAALWTMNRTDFEDIPGLALYND